MEKLRNEIIRKLNVISGLSASNIHIEKIIKSLKEDLFILEKTIKENEDI